MTVSSAIPIKFYLDGVLSFNTKPIAQIDPIPFFDRVKSSQNIMVQIQDSNFTNYELKILDDGVVINSIVFTRTLVDTVYVYQTNFTFLSLGISGKRISLQVVEDVTGISGGISMALSTVSGNVSFVSTVFSIDGGVSNVAQTIAGSGTFCMCRNVTATANANITDFWYIDCIGTLHENISILNTVTYPFCACTTKPNQWSVLDVTIVNLNTPC